MSETTLGTFLGWTAMGPGRKSLTCPRCHTAIELRLMDDLLEVACPACGASPFHEAAIDFEREHGSEAARAALSGLGLLSDEELTLAIEVAGPAEAGVADRGLVSAARALGFFQKSLFLAHTEGGSEELQVKPLRELVGLDELQESVEVERQEGRPTGEVVTSIALAAQKERLRNDLADEPSLDLDTLEVPVEAAQLIPPALASSLLVIPVRLEDETLVVAVADPLDFTVIDSLKFHIGHEVKAVGANEGQLFRALERIYAEAGAPPLDDEIDAEHAAITGPGDELAILAGEAHAAFEAGGFEPEDEDLEDSVPDLPDEAPGARTLNSLLVQVADERAEQLLLEPLEMYYRVRIRRGGRLRDAVRVTRSVGEAVIERAMVRAGMDPSQPGSQTGRINIQVSGELLEFEAALTDSVLGRSLGLRARETRFRALALEGLALVPGDAQLLRRGLELPAGLTVIASPAGEGKTTLLYALMREVDRNREHVVALERVNRSRIEGVTQIARSRYRTLAPVLQQLQPDRVFLDDLPGRLGAEGVADEVRLALDLALNGSRVVIAVEAPSPLAAVARLAATGVEPRVLFSALRGLCGLRLVRRVCQRCREDFDAPEALAERLGLPMDEPMGRRVSIGIGCWECDGRGYRGRSALMEFTPLTERHLVEAALTLDPVHLSRVARKAGHRRLADKALAALRAGLTSPTQVESILGR